jgi:hypothetical protein
MKQIRISTPPEKTARGPVHDFKTAVLKEHSYLALSTLYWFGQTAVRFFVRRNLYGADFYKPCKYGFEITRINTKGIRRHIGFTDNLLTTSQP